MGVRYALLLLVLACVFILPAHAQTVSSTGYAPFTAPGIITGLNADPLLHGPLYLRTANAGAFRWDRGQRRWQPLLEQVAASDRNLLGVESLALDPEDPQKVYIAAGASTSARASHAALLRSSDEGRHFASVPLPFQLGADDEARYGGERLAVDPNSGQVLMLATRRNGLWRSGDSGASWHQVREFPALPLNDVGLLFVAFDRGSGPKGRSTPVILVGVSDPVVNLLRSDDAGRSWKPVVGGPLGMFPRYGVFGTDGTLYLSYSDSPLPGGIHNGAVWAYAPRTRAWRDITPERSRSPLGFGYGAFAVDTAHAGTVTVATMNRVRGGDMLFRTVDGGAHWNSLALADVGLSSQLKNVRQATGKDAWVGTVLSDPSNPARTLYATGNMLREAPAKAGP